MHTSFNIKLEFIIQTQQLSIKWQQREFPTSDEIAARILEHSTTSGMEFHFYKENAVIIIEECSDGIPLSQQISVLT